MSTATQTIHGYTAAVAIDATADYFLIDPASTGNYLKINRNVALGITGNPLGHTDTQVVSNKTLNVTNTITAKDSLLTLQNVADLTKQVNFSLAGITTGTTRTITLPNRSDTLVTLGGTETLTAKTLTSPTITGGSLDNTTITVDSISGHTVGTTVTVGGVQMANGIVATTGAVNTNSIAAGAVVPNSLVASSGSGWVWQACTPTLDNVTIGNGTLSASYVQVGKTVFCRVTFVLGSTSAITGSVLVSMPVAPKSDYNSHPYIIGGLWCDDSGVTNYQGIVITTSSKFNPGVVGTASTYLGPTTSISGTVPFSFGTGDSFSLYAAYEAA